MTHDQLDSFILAHCEKSGGAWTCKICDKASGHRHHIVRHIETYHVDLPTLICDLCGAPSKTRDSLKVHVKKYHKDPIK